MSKYAIESTTLTNIASAIRSKKGTSDSYTPLEMPAAIRSISGGGGGGIDIEGATEITITNTTNDTLKEKNIYNYGKYTWIPPLQNGLSFSSSTYGNSNYQFPICISDNKWLIIAPGDGSAGTVDYNSYAWLATIDENNNVNINTDDRTLVIGGSSSSSGGPPFLCQIFDINANNKLLLFARYYSRKYYYELVKLTIASEVNSLTDCIFSSAYSIDNYTSNWGGASGYFDEETSTFISMVGPHLKTYKIDVDSTTWITDKSSLSSPASADRYMSSAICKIRSGQFAIAQAVYSSVIRSYLFTINVSAGAATIISNASYSFTSYSGNATQGPSNLVAIGNDESGNVYLCHAIMQGYPITSNLLNGFTTYKVDTNNTITQLQNTIICEKYGMFRSFGGSILPLDNNLFLFVDLCGTSCYRLNQDSGSLTEVNYVRYSNTSSEISRANYIPIDDNNILIMTCTNGSYGGITFILLNYDNEGHLGYQTVTVTDEISSIIQNQGTSGPLQNPGTDYFLYNRLNKSVYGNLHDAITSKWFYNISPSRNIMHNFNGKLLISKIVEQDCITKNGSSLYKIIPISDIAAGETGQAYLFK